MGACASCLESCFGADRKHDHERDPLLASTSAPYGYLHYPPSPTAIANAGHGLPDPQQAIHEREYLERLVAQTSEHLIDIFAPPMLTGAPTSMSITPSSRGEWYRGLLDRTSPPMQHPITPVVLDPQDVSESERKWLDSLLKRGEEAVREVGNIKGVDTLMVNLD